MNSGKESDLVSKLTGGEALWGGKEKGQTWATMTAAELEWLVLLTEEPSVLETASLSVDPFRPDLAT